MTSTESKDDTITSGVTTATTTETLSRGIEGLTIDDGNMLPVAAICANLDLYIQSFHYRYVGNILEEIHQLTDGTFVLASSNIDSMYNCGFVTRFDSLENIPKVASLYINPGFGPCSNLVVTKKSSPSLLICGFDSGNILALGQEKLNIVENHLYSHNLITTLRLNGSETQLLAADYDGRIVVIEVESFDAVKIFDSSHGDGPVNDLTFHPENESQFLSCGGDNEVLLWDLRTPSSSGPAVAQLVSSTQPTALYWPSEKEIIFATEGGSVVRYDLRTQKPLLTVPLFADRSVHKIVPLKEGKSVAFLVNEVPQMVIYSADLSTLQHRETYDRGVNIRSLIELKSSSEEKKKVPTTLVAIGSGQSVFQHEDILRKL